MRRFYHCDNDKHWLAGHPILSALPLRALLDPKNDYVFKRLFADDPALLADLINAVRHRAAPITDLTVRNPAIDAAELQGKYIVLDLLAEDADGAQFNAEMQVRRHPAWSARSTY